MSTKQIKLQQIKKIAPYKIRYIIDKFYNIRNYLEKKRVYYIKAMVDRFTFLSFAVVNNNTNLRASTKNQFLATTKKTN